MMNQEALQEVLQKVSELLLLHTEQIGELTNIAKAQREDIEELKKLMRDGE